MCETHSPKQYSDHIYSSSVLREVLLKKAKGRAKKKPRRRSDSSGGYTLSEIIHSPPAAGTHTHTHVCTCILYILQQVVLVSCLSSSFCPAVSPVLVKTGKANSTESLQEVLTSDSEGSYMAVGSPRDMQSPVFHDKPEVILHLC